MDARTRLNLIACTLLEALPPEGMGEGPLVTVVWQATQDRGDGSFESARADIEALVRLGLLERKPGHLVVRGPHFDAAAAAYGELRARRVS